MGIETSSSNQEEVPKQERVKRFFGHGFEISKFEEGDQIPVGGKSFLSPEIDITVEGDFESFREFFQETHDMANKYDLTNLKEWLDLQAIEIDEKLFAQLYAFTQKLEEKYPDNPKRSETRKKLYGEKGTHLKLSDIFNENSAMCAEIAALAQRYLQGEDISSSYFGGDVLWSKEREYSENHSFVIIRHGEKIYIYDPTNHTDTDQGKFPSIYTTEVDFDEEMAKGKKRFVTARNILSKNEAFYGVNNGTNILAEKHII